MTAPKSEIALLNFYRASELHGGLILGQMVRRTRDPELILNLTRHSAEEVGTPLTMLEILALTQVFERRVYRHFTDHLQRPDLHPAIATTLRRMLDEERGHLTWVKHWLDKQAATRPTEVREVMRRYAAADEVIYAAISAEYGWRLAA